MNPGQILKSELKSLAATTLFFGSWLLVLVVLKKLVLEEYHIEFRGFSLALIGALVIAKVVLVLEHVSLGKWVEHRPAVLDLALRTVLYGVGVAIMLLLEKAFESRHENGGFLPALVRVFEHRDIHHVWANVICLSCALLAFNTLSVLKRHFGTQQLARVFFSRPSHDSGQATRQEQSA